MYVYSSMELYLKGLIFLWERIRTQDNNKVSADVLCYLRHFQVFLATLIRNVIAKCNSDVTRIIASDDLVIYVKWQI